MAPLSVEWFLNEELVAVSQWCQASQGSTPHSWATCPPPPGFDPSTCKTNPDHRWEGFKEFYPNAMGLSKGSKLALQLVWFPFYVPLWKLDLHLVLLYRALSYIYQSLWEYAPALLLLDHMHSSPTVTPTWKGGQGCFVPKWGSFSGSLLGLLRLPAWNSLTCWEAQFLPRLLLWSDFGILASACASSPLDTCSNLWCSSSFRS